MKRYDKEKRELIRFIRSTRKQKGLLQKDLAEAVGVDRTWVNHIEKDESRSPSFDMLFALCEILGYGFSIKLIKRS